MSEERAPYRGAIPPVFTDRMVELNDEVERFASFDHSARRFIAYAISLVPELGPLINTDDLPGGNAPAPFVVSEAEATERAAAYAALPKLRACTAKGPQGQRQRRLHFGLLLEMAWVDLKWKRLTSLPAFIYCYERVVGPAWRQLLPLAWREAVRHRRRRTAPQLPLDGRLTDDEAVPNALEDDPAPWYFPSLADADAVGGAPLLAGL